MFSQSLTTTLRILFFRSGPQDFPYAEGLVRMLLPLAALANYLMFVLVLPAGMSVLMALAVVASLGMATRTLLRLRKLESRFQQTFNALLATNAALTLAMIPPFAQMAPEIAKLAELAQHPDVQESQAVLNVPASAAFIANVLNIWSFAVSIHIFRQAAGVKLAAGVLIALLVAGVMLIFVVFSGSLGAALLGLGHTAG